LVALRNLSAPQLSAGPLGGEQKGNNMRILALVFLFAIIISVGVARNNVDSIQTTPQNLFSFDADLGIGLLGVTYNAGISYRMSNTFVGARYLHSHQITAELGPFGGGDTHFQRPIESIWEIDGYIGRTVFDRGFRASALIGLCVTGGILRGNFISTDNIYDQYESLEKTVIGIPIQAQLTYIPEDYVGVSVSYFANFNSKKTFRGLLLSLNITVH
jgi:hypothetical protein